MATTTYFRDRIKALMRDLKTAKNESLKWFSDAIKAISGKTPSAQRERFKPVRNVSPKLAGRMIAFFYDPKHKDRLPYYDRFPLVFPVGFGPGYFIGINVHYLSPQMREAFYMELMELYNGRHMNERTRLNTTYQTLQYHMNRPYYKPAVKKYLYSHLRSKIFVVNPDDWEFTLFLPTEKFVKRSKEFVWKESSQRIRGW